jgi:hypothetical protein
LPLSSLDVCMTRLHAAFGAVTKWTHSCQLPQTHYLFHFMRLLYLLISTLCDIWLKTLHRV